MQHLFLVLDWALAFTILYVPLIGMVRVVGKFPHSPKHRDWRAGFFTYKVWKLLTLTAIGLGLSSILFSLGLNIAGFATGAEYVLLLVVIGVLPDTNMTLRQ